MFNNIQGKLNMNFVYVKPDKFLKDKKEYKFYYEDKRDNHISYTKIMYTDHNCLGNIHYIVLSNVVSLNSFIGIT